MSNGSDFEKSGKDDELQVKSDYNVSENKSSISNITMLPENVTSNSTLPNKWAVLCADPYESAITGGMSNFLFDDYLLVYDCLIKLAFHPDHIISLLNETLTKKNIESAFDRIDNQSLDSKNATVVFWAGSHGFSMPGVFSHGIYNSYFQIREDNTTSVMWTALFDYELDEILDGHEYGKTLIHIESCQSGCFAAEDTTGQFHGATDLLYGSCGGPNRIIITDSTAPLDAWGGDSANIFWKQGLIGNGGDSNPITGNNDGQTSIEEAYFYYKTIGPISEILHPFVYASQPCMNDQYPADNPEWEMFI